MISELVRPVEKEDFQVPAVVFLTPKRRCRPPSTVGFEDEAAGGSVSLIASPTRRGHKLKRSGRVVFRWAKSNLPLGAVQAPSYLP
jgi:hypothetical protein